MKLPIKKKYFDLIKSGEKRVEFRDAHITFVCEGTGEQLRKNIKNVKLKPIRKIPVELYGNPMLTDRYQIWFYLK